MSYHNRKNGFGKAHIMSQDAGAGTIRLHARENLIVLTKAFPAGSQPAGLGNPLPRNTPSGTRLPQLIFRKVPQ